MASNTPNLNLLKKDPLIDGDDTFNITTMLNENWDKIDTDKKAQDDALIAHKAETVHQYEEGVFTPSLRGTTTAGANTYSKQLGRYIRKGNEVTVYIELTLTAKDISIAGNIDIAGLPFSAKNDSVNAGATLGAVANITLATGRTQFTAVVLAGLSQIRLYSTGSNTSLVAITDTAIQNNTQIVMSGTYRI